MVADALNRNPIGRLHNLISYDIDDTIEQYDLQLMHPFSKFSNIIAYPDLTEKILIQQSQDLFIQSLKNKNHDFSYDKEIGL